MRTKYEGELANDDKARDRLAVDRGAALLGKR